MLDDAGVVSRYLDTRFLGACVCLMICSMTHRQAVKSLFTLINLVSFPLQGVSLLELTVWTGPLCFISLSLHSVFFSDHNLHPFCFLNHYFHLWKIINVWAPPADSSSLLCLIRTQRELRLSAFTAPTTAVLFSVILYCTEFTLTGFNLVSPSIALSCFIQLNSISAKNCNAPFHFSQLVSNRQIVCS